jgi:hypothetical protein
MMKFLWRSVVLVIGLALLFWAAIGIGQAP